MDIDLNLGKLYLPLDRTNNEIRLLRLFGPQDRSLIRCHLETFKLDEAPVFTALSYSWGNPSSQHRICLDGHVTQVNANLHRLLQSLTTLHGKNKRNPQEWLWIDALCIDQDSLEERGHQVQLFSRIYSRAEEVLAWLGPGSSNSDRCVKALARDPSYWQSQRRLLWFWKNGAGHGAVEICRKRYWSRLWTFQELLNAKRVLLLCGLRYIAWDSFVSNLNCLLAIQKLPQRHEHVRDSVIGSPAVSRLAQGHGHRRYPTVFMAMRETKHLECTLAHDRVYALLGVVDSRIQTAYDMPLAVLLNSVLREHHTFARPDTCDSVISDCKELCEMLNMDLASMFDCLNGWGSQVAPSKADVELMPFSEQGSHCNLWWATFYGHRCVQDLLFQNAIITEGDVVRACKVGCSAALVTILKAAPFNCNRIREEGKTLMSLAISYGHAAVVCCLLDTPAFQIGLVSETRPGIETFSSFDEKGRTYLTHAIRCNNDEIVELLLQDQRCGPNAKEQSGLTALHVAVLYGPLEVISKLLDSGRCNIYSRDGKDRTALTLALSEIKEVKKVLQSGSFHDGWSKYQRRLRKQSEKLVFAITLLVRQEVSLANSNGAEPSIVQAAAMGSASIVQDLLYAGAPPDLANGKGQTPLMAIIRRRLWRNEPEKYRRVMQLLLENGANANAVDKLDHTPLSLAIIRDLPAAIGLLIAHGADVHAPLANGYSYLSLATAFGREEAAALLLENGVNVDAKDSGGQSALSQAILGRNDPGMNFLIENGAKVYAHDKEGHSMMALAILTRNHYATARLISHGVDVEEKDTCGNTALCLAASSYDETELKKAPDPNTFWDAIKVIIYLLKDGHANKNAKNSRGHVPEEIARRAGNKDIASLIASYPRRPQWIEEERRLIRECFFRPEKR